MENENDRGASPDAQTVTPPATVNPEASSLQKDTDTMVQGINTPADAARLIRELTTPKAKEPVTPTATTPETQTPEVAATQPEGAAEPTPDAPNTDTPPAEPAPNQEPEPEPNDDDGVVTPIKSDRPHVKVNKEDDHGRLTLAYQVRNKDWTLKQCSDAADKQLGIKAEPEPSAQPDPAKPKSDLPETVEAADAAIETLQNERFEANKLLDFEKAAELSSKIEKLIFQKLRLENIADRRQQEQVSAETKAFEASQVRAADTYDFAKDPASAGGKRMIEIDQALYANKDPLFDDPNKPFIIAQMVAKELLIAPKVKGAAPVKPVAPVAKPVGAPPVAKPNQVLPGGGSRTSTPQDPSGQLLDNVGKAANLWEVKAALKNAGLRVPGM